MHTLFDQKIPIKQMTFDRWLIAIIGLCLIGFSAVSGVLGLAEILGYNPFVYLFAGTLETSKIAGVIALRRLKAPAAVQAYLKVFIPVLIVLNMAASFSLLSKFMQDRLNVAAQMESSQELAQSRFTAARKALADITAERAQALNQLPATFTVGRVRLMDAYATPIHNAAIQVEASENAMQIARSLPVTHTSLSQIAEAFHLNDGAVQNTFLVILVMVLDPMGITLFAAAIPTPKMRRGFPSGAPQHGRNRFRGRQRNRSPSLVPGRSIEPASDEDSLFPAMPRETP